MYACLLTLTLLFLAFQSCTVKDHQYIYALKEETGTQYPFYVKAHLWWYATSEGFIIGFGTKLTFYYDWYAPKKKFIFVLVQKVNNTTGEGTDYDLQQHTVQGFGDKKKKGPSFRCWRARTCNFNHSLSLHRTYISTAKIPIKEEKQLSRPKQVIKWTCLGYMPLELRPVYFSSVVNFFLLFKRSK